MPYSYYKDTIIDLIDSADIIVDYNINFDLSFLLDDDYYDFLHSDSSKVIVDVMHLFSRVWGEWSSYYKSYKYQNLITCANYYDFRFDAHDSLEDVKTTLYCYPRVSYDCNFNIYDYIK